MLRAEKDFEEFIELLNKYEVEYMIVGAYALSIYAQPRNTGDMDFFINRNSKNAKLLKKVLHDFGFESSDIETGDFETKGRIIQLGVSPVRIDIINEIDGVSFSDAYERVERFKFGSVYANFISKVDLIKNKSSSSRKKDQADLEELNNFDNN